MLPRLPDGLTTAPPQNQMTDAPPISRQGPGLPPGGAPRSAGHAVPGCGKDVDPLRRDRLFTLAAQSKAAVVDPGECRLRVVQLLPGRRDQARGHLEPTDSSPVVTLVGSRAGRGVGQFDDVCDLLTPLLLEQGAVLRQPLEERVVASGR